MTPADVEISWTKVVEGAVQCELLSLGRVQAVNVRLSRFNYGFTFSVPFDPEKHRPEDSYPCKWEKIDGKPVLKAHQICWLVKKV